MLRYCDDQSLELVSESDLKANQILERYDLQAAIVRSWAAFTNEIGMPDIYLIGQEIQPHSSVRDAIDILAYDPNENVPVVIELKRDRNKLQLLQALSYAAMVSAWTDERFIAEAKKQNVPDLEDVVDSFGGVASQENVRVVLIAERFDPEVIITSDWLYREFSLDVTAFGIEVFKHAESTYFRFHQRYPLPELQDTFDLRTTSRKKTQDRSGATWDDVIPELTYPWAAEAVAMCQRCKEGEPARRRFGSLRTNQDGFRWISINFRRKYVNVYMRGLPDNAEELLQSKFDDPITVERWRDGHSFKITKEGQFKDLVRWLDL